MKRPFLNAGIAELEAEFRRRNADADFLSALLAELEHRTVPRAARLREAAGRALASVRTAGAPAPDSPPAAPPRPAHDPAAPAAAPPWARPSSPDVSAPVAHAFPPVTNAPVSICDAWTGLEVLSPPTFLRPEDLAPGRERRAVACLEGAHLPWEQGGERSRPGKRLYYQVVLGTIKMEQAVRRMLSTFSDTRAERPGTRGHAVLAVAIVDSAGRPAGAPAAVLSSFAWGVPHVLRGDLVRLAGWTAAEGPLLEGLEKQLLRVGANDERIPLTSADLKRAFEWLVGALGLPSDVVEPPSFAIRNYEYFRSQDPPKPLLLNSFFLRDLAAVRARFAAGRSTHLLRQYFGEAVPEVRPNLLTDLVALAGAVAPRRIPPSRWPGPGRHPLVLLQQAAVNLGLHELPESGILAVNGPPGTGKTTLLRDLVAAVVTRRAEAMIGFDNPATAFLPSGEKLNAGGSWQHLYRLDPRLRGFEMVVASSNNKAVENVSAELPALRAVAEDATELRYFKTLSDALSEEETWGLVAAVLGNAGNQNRFRQTFWWDEEVGLARYLKEAAGTPQVVQVTDPDTGQTVERPPRIVAMEDPPRTHDQALERWRRAQSSFRTAVDRSGRHLKELARVHDLAVTVSGLAATEEDAALSLKTAREQEHAAASRVPFSRKREEQAHSRFRAAERVLAEHDWGRPSFFARLFRTRLARAWHTGRGPLARTREQARTEAAEARRARSAAERAAEEAATIRTAAERRLANAAARHATASSEVEAARRRLGDRFVDADFFARDRTTVQNATPWIDHHGQLLRDEVYIEAMRLHRAFIDAAARPLRHNLGVLMGTMAGRTLPTPEKQALLPDLWASLFLVVPLISTTFASVERMLGALPPETLGWLLVDEAGQALPQAAVGALLRARRAIVVGDPIQIQPVVILPDTLTHAICRHFGVDSDRFNAPVASVQTLADAATPYGAEFEIQQGSRSVGIPLLVHRRCAEPMFEISNVVAYERLMVNAKLPAHSPIGGVIGPSGWIDIEGSAEEKWSPDEGEAVLDLLRRLRSAEVVPDLYVVTPFVVVADQLRRLVRDSGLLGGWVDDPWQWTLQRIGTVHTVQGREAEAVIFVLGAPSPHQTGARRWAGGSPNLLNVAVTRAKERLYVIGNRRLWRSAGVFGQLDALLPS